MNNKVLLILSEEYWRLVDDVLEAFSETPLELQGLLAEARNPGFVAIRPSLLDKAPFDGVLEIPLAAVVMIVSEATEGTGFHAIHHKARTKQA